MYSPTISLIIPIYNRSKWLKRAIDSIYFVEFDEVIVINDGSDKKHTDEIEKILDNYPKIKYIKHDTNKGLGEARNTGIKNSKSEWITFLDDDDYYTKNPLENLKKHITKYPEADVINYKITLKKGEKTVEWGHETFTLEDLVNYNRLTGSSLLKKSVWAKVKGYKNIPYEDWEFWVRVKRGGFNFVFFNDIFYVRDMVEDGLEKTQEN
jgi:glycosyltransferase involved in cell wall biosynthesis